MKEILLKFVLDNAVVIGLMVLGALGVLVIPKIRKAVKDSPNKVDDALVLPILDGAEKAAKDAADGKLDGKPQG